MTDRPSPAPDTSPERQPMFSLSRDDVFGFGVAALLLAAFLVLGTTPFIFERYGLSAEALRDGRWWTPLTHMAVHGGWAHLLFNATALLSFARVLSMRTGFWRLTVLFLASGLAGAAAFVAINPEGAVPAVGASGAVSGLWGAAARLGPVRYGALPLTSRPVLAQVQGFAVSNLILFGLFWLLTAGMGGIAWEAHLGGFVLGLLLAPAFVRRQQGPWG